MKQKGVKDYAEKMNFKLFAYAEYLRNFNKLYEKLTVKFSNKL